MILTSLSRKITNLITYLDFIQNENVSDVLHPVQLQIYFENESGDKISGDVFITANKKDETPEKRQFRERFAFKNARYTKNEKYFLVMKDTNTDDEVARHEFIIDIAFADDFGFGV